MAPYLTLDPAASRIPVSAGGLHYPALVAHIGFAFVALATGLVQWVEAIRLRRLALHRALGRVYLVSVGASALLAFVLVAYMDSFTKATGFFLLAVVWLMTSWNGLRAALRRQWDTHRRWMARSFGITLVAVSGRLLVPPLLLAYAALHGFSLPEGREAMVEAVLNVNIWAGLVVNLIIVEWVILKK